MNNTFIETLVSEHGHPRLQDKLKPYKIFIGAWEFDWAGHEDDGSTWTVPGEWHFAWILEGRAIQDNWICPRLNLRSSGKYPDGEYGTTIRFYDFKENCIKVIWVGPILSQLTIFKAHHSKDQIVQNEQTVGDKGKSSRWVFKDINKNSFKWEAYTTDDDQNMWKMNQEVYAKRKSST
ncbi:hypothetical protein ACFL27_11765 [candidate division CSSED10-310 bacterium]|uniref:Uncharacterized protein n=1 Tax=candidate division CSSED10-310 bacterium TaxID=2855610 RepID=A0ABV6YXR5_UNCC1